MKTRSSLTTRALLACALLAAPIAWAAGGHHAVDDASLLDEGRCELEGWFERSSTPGRLLHLGLGCRVGPVELGAATEPQRQAGASIADHGLQVKWATELAPGLSAGLAAGAGWQAHARPRFQGTTATALVSWSPVDNIGLHANFGRDFVHRGGDQSRGGVAVDWSPGGGPWQLSAERFRQEGGHFARVGVRWSPARDWTLDLSRAVRRRGAGDSSWTVGLTREFER